MPTPPLPDDVRALLAEANPAVIATVRADGQPVTVATRYLLDGETILCRLVPKALRHSGFQLHPGRVGCCKGLGEQQVRHSGVDKPGALTGRTGWLRTRRRRLSVIASMSA